MIELAGILSSNEKRILLVVLDGLGGLPIEGKTELEAANKPNLCALAENSSLGLTLPVDYGISPGSAPAHLSLFGRDPIEYEIGRGIMEALGIGLEIKEDDLCIRANFATREGDKITDRRAGRLKNHIPPDEMCKLLCAELQKGIEKIEDIEVIIRPGKEHRFVIVLRGKRLSTNIRDTDPGKDNPPLPPNDPLPKDEDDGDAKFTSTIIKSLIDKAVAILQTKAVREIVAGCQKDPNYILLRGYSKKPNLPPFSESYKLNPACIAVYPMYKGIASLLGMKVLETHPSWEGEIDCLGANKDKFDFFYLHFKETDMEGENGNFWEKVKWIERFDSLLPRILEMKFDVIAITSDHSTPARLRSHSWHPNPFLLFSPYCRPDGIRQFDERACAKGSLGIFPALKVMPLLLAHSLKLKKFGA